MTRAEASRKRCAIYTRKSSEEGLEQEFNSLAAQREACEAFIRSQRDEGWVLAKIRYDDVERPALQNLLADIRAGRMMPPDRSVDHDTLSILSGVPATRVMTTISSGGQSFPQPSFLAQRHGELIDVEPGPGSHDDGGIFYWKALIALTRVWTIPQTSGMPTKPQARASLAAL